MLYSKDSAKLEEKMDQFIGRKKELALLESLIDKDSASLVVVRGRRRIGKSRLIQEFGKKMRMLKFSGLPPVEKTSKKDQLLEFGWQLGKELGQPAFKDDDWGDLFLRLANHTRQGRVVILFDEISWMGSKDHNFLGKLKNAWDLEFKKNPKLILILCGSVSSWIEENIISNTGFVGRISLNIDLQELSLPEANHFWDKAKYISAYEKYKILAITGGVPKYLEEIRKNISAEANIKHLCFEQAGFLFNEFEQIFSDIFNKRSATYKKIVESIIDSGANLEELSQRIGMESSGVISKYLRDLELSGFIARDYNWNITNGKISKLSKYRIKDNYLRFYLKYIDPNKEKIAKGDFQDRSITSLPGYDGIMGLSFENLVLNNRRKIKKILHIYPGDIIYDNPFFQKNNQSHAGCQIDYLIQTKYNSLYIVEIKFSRNKIGMEVITEMKEKIDKLKLAKNFSLLPVLIHVNGVTEELQDSRFFAKIIDFAELLEE